MTEYFNFIHGENPLAGVVVSQYPDGSFGIVVHDDEEIIDTWKIEKGLDNVVALLYHLKEMGFYGNQERITLQ